MFSSWSEWSRFPVGICIYRCAVENTRTGSNGDGCTKCKKGLFLGAMRQYNRCMQTTGLLTLRPRRPDDDKFIRTIAHVSFVRYSHAPDRSIMAMLREPSAKALVAEVDGVLLGFAVVSFQSIGRAFGPWEQPSVASLDAMAVRPDAQGRGVGRALLGSAEDMARKQGAVCMTLRTATLNIRALSLFRAVGYQATVEIASFYRDGQPALAMTKLLSNED